MKQMSITHNHPFHMVTLSPWPLILSFNIMNFMISIIIFLNFSNNLILIFNMMIMLITLYQWWRDIIRESTMQGSHTLYILKLLKFSMMLFIISELFFFISFFWTYFHNSISLNMEIGNTWPPKNIILMNPYDIPLLNSIILISSGLTITTSHHYLINNFKMKSLIYLLFTIILGMYFLLFQYLEYKEASFTMNDSIYGAIFFMTTGFHGMHVMIGTIFLIICFIRMMNNHFSKIHHFNFESASWYWHFVDIIWLFLYLIYYWWIF